MVDDSADSSPQGVASSWLSLLPSLPVQEVVAARTSFLWVPTLLYLNRGLFVGRKFEGP